MMTGFVESVAMVASIATAVGVLLAWWQIKQARHRAVTSLEDAMAREYREIAQQIPVAALLSEKPPEDEFRQALDNFYHYIDLSNEQTFLCQLGRISSQTWANWREGIESNLARPAFQRAWQMIKEKSPASFTELRRLEAESFRSDPWRWR